MYLLLAVLRIIKTGETKIKVGAYAPPSPPNYAYVGTFPLFLKFLITNNKFPKFTVLGVGIEQL